MSRKARAPARAQRSSAGRREPFTGSRFSVDIDGFGRFGVMEVVLPESRVVRTGRRSAVVHSALTLRRGQTTDSQWYDWWAESRRRRAASARYVTLELLDAQGAAQLRWSFPRTLPQAYAVSPLSALRESVVLESLELAVGDFVLEPLR